jgi:Mg2+ and Co2+ transporter CorA
MRSYLIDRSGAVDVELDRAGLERLREREGFWWLDLQAPGHEDLALVGEVLAFHPLAIEDATHFGQRPKLEEYDDFAFLVVYDAAPDEDDLVEVHCFYSDRFLVTVRRDDCPAFAEARERHERRPDRLAGAIDAYLSTVSNRLNDVTKQLAVIATIFLPLTFLTGFFGQNFAWMVDAVGGEAEFWALGVALQALALLGLLALFRRRGWF